MLSSQLDSLTNLTESVILGKIVEVELLRYDLQNDFLELVLRIERRSQNSSVDNFLPWNSSIKYIWQP